MKNWKAVALILGVFLFVPDVAFGASGDDPWSTFLQKISDALTGPTAKAVAGIATVAFGIAMAFLDGHAVRRALAIVVAGTIVASVGTWVLPNLKLNSAALLM